MFLLRAVRRCVLLAVFVVQPFVLVNDALADEPVQAAGGQQKVMTLRAPGELGVAIDLSFNPVDGVALSQAASSAAQNSNAGAAGALGGMIGAQIVRSSQISAANAKALKPIEQLNEWLHAQDAVAFWTQAFAVAYNMAPEQVFIGRTLCAVVRMSCAFCRNCA